MDERDNIRGNVAKYISAKEQIASLERQIEREKLRMIQASDEITAIYPKVLCKLSEVPGIPVRVIKALAKMNYTMIVDLMYQSQSNGYLRRVHGVSEENMRIVSKAIHEFVGITRFSLWGR